LHVSPVFNPLPGKTGLHIGIPVGFSGSGWAKIGSENFLDSRAFDGLWEWCISAVFWLTERFKGVFSTGTEKRELSGFSGIGPGTRGRKEAHRAVIWVQGLDPMIPGLSYGG
jgi:hypothetical protein